TAGAGTNSYQTVGAASRPGRPQHRERVSAADRAVAHRDEYLSADLVALPLLLRIYWHVQQGGGLDRRRQLHEPALRPLHLEELYRYGPVHAAGRRRAVAHRLRHGAAAAPDVPPEEYRHHADPAADDAFAGRGRAVLAVSAGRQLGPGQLDFTDPPPSGPGASGQLAQRPAKRALVAGHRGYLDVVALCDADLAGRAGRRAAASLRGRRGGPRLRLVQVPLHHYSDGLPAGDDRAPVPHDGLLQNLRHGLRADGRRPRRRDQDRLLQPL